jgi:hypothetical protein
MSTHELNKGDRVRVTASNRMYGYQPGDKGTVLRPVRSAITGETVYVVAMDKDGRGLKCIFRADEIDPTCEHGRGGAAAGALPAATAETNAPSRPFGRGRPAWPVRRNIQVQVGAAASIPAENAHEHTRVEAGRPGAPHRALSGAVLPARRQGYGVLGSAGGAR